MRWVVVWVVVWVVACLPTRAGLVPSLGPHVAALRATPVTSLTPLPVALPALVPVAMVVPMAPLLAMVPLLATVRPADTAASPASSSNSRQAPVAPL